MTGSVAITGLKERMYDAVDSLFGRPAYHGTRVAARCVGRRGDSHGDIAKEIDEP